MNSNAPAETLSRLIKVLAHGPHTAAGIGRALGCTSSRAGYMLAVLTRPGGPAAYIGRLATVMAADVDVVDADELDSPLDRKFKVKVYALAGHQTYFQQHAPTPRRRSKSGSGVIAGPRTIRGYLW